VYFISSDQNFRKWNIHPQTFFGTNKAIFTWGNATSRVDELLITPQIVNEQFEIVEKITFVEGGICAKKSALTGGNSPAAGQ
jgi:hypothetical protein